MSDCFNIKSHGTRYDSSYKDDEWWSDNCRVTVSNDPISGILPSIKGSWLKRTVQNILDNCDSGFKYHDGSRVDVALCQIGMYGKKIDCSSPMQKVEGFPVKKRLTNAIDIAKRRHLVDIRATSPNTPGLAVRSNSP